MGLRKFLISSITIGALFGGGISPAFATPMSSTDPFITVATSAPLVHRRLATEAAPKFWMRFGRTFGRHATKRHWGWVRHHTSTRRVFRAIKHHRQDGPYKVLACWGNPGPKWGECEYTQYRYTELKRRPDGRVVVWNLLID